MCQGGSLPGLRKRLNAVAEGMIDLMEPFRRRDIYHWRMVGEISDPNPDFSPVR